jgi:hypothetical protein
VLLQFLLAANVCFFNLQAYHAAQGLSATTYASKSTVACRAGQQCFMPKFQQLQQQRLLACMWVVVVRIEYSKCVAC